MSHDNHTHHVSSPQVLIATFLALVALTILTVAVSSAQRSGALQLGSWDMVVVLTIATVKAALVAVIFMHLQHDKLFNGILLIGATLFMVLFVGMVLLDSKEYQPDITDYVYDQKAMAAPE